MHISTSIMICPDIYLLRANISCLQIKCLQIWYTHGKYLNEYTPYWSVSLWAWYASSELETCQIESPTHQEKYCADKYWQIFLMEVTRSQLNYLIGNGSVLRQKLVKLQFPLHVLWWSVSVVMMNHFSSLFEAVQCFYMLVKYHVVYTYSIDKYFNEWHEKNDVNLKNIIACIIYTYIIDFKCHCTSHWGIKGSDWKSNRIVPTRWSRITEPPLVGQVPLWVCMMKQPHM